MPDPAQTGYIHPFVGIIPQLKAVGSDDGEWVVSGPINADGEDYDGDILTNEAVWKGLELYKKFGKLVDWGHRYAQTGEAKWLIGTGEPFKGPDGRPWLKITLNKAKEIARQAWEHIQADMPCGLSIEGIFRSSDRDPKDKRRIQSSEIHRITIDPSPKGFGNFLQVGVPSGSMVAIAKALATGDAPMWIPETQWQDDLPGAPRVTVQLAGLDSLLERVTRIEKALRPVRKDARHPADREDCPHCGASCERGDDGYCNRCGKPWPARTQKGMGGDSEASCPYCNAIVPQGADLCDSCGKSLEGAQTVKALTAGAGVVQPGATGGQALRGQNLQSSAGPAQRACPHCRCKNRITRFHCRSCGKPLAQPSHSPGRDIVLTKALESAGVRNASSVAARIGRLRK